jgi:hypothetical protein
MPRFIRLSSFDSREQPRHRASIAHRLGAVAASSCVSHASASGRDAPHICGCGIKPEQQAGRSGRPKIRHRSCSSSCTQRTPAGLPSGMPGIGLEIEGAMQQAPQPGRHACSCSCGR